MNSLSWLLYFADVLPNLAHTAGFVLFFGCFAFLISASGHTVASTAPDVPDNIKAFAGSFIKKSVLVLVLAAVPYLFIPSKETFYLIAGSEAGEYVVTTPEAKEILGDIKDVIKAQLEDLKSNDSKTTN